MIHAKYIDGKTIKITDESILLRGSFTEEGNKIIANSIEILNVFFNLLKEFKNPVLLDIGACTGSYSMLGIVHEMTIHAFEPVPKTYRNLVENIKLNKISNVKTYNMAVSDYAGKGTLNVVIHDNCIALSMLDGRPHHLKEVREIEIPVTSIDFFCKENAVIPDFIKIDTEGNELKVLEGAKDIISKHRPIILCEYNKQNTNQYGYEPERIKEFLEAQNYTCNIDNGDLLATI